MSRMRALFTKLVEEKKQALDPAHIERVRQVRDAIGEINRDGDFHASILTTGDGQYNGFLINMKSPGGYISETVMLENEEVKGQTPVNLAEMIVEKAAEQSAKTQRVHRYLDAARPGK